MSRLIDVDVLKNAIHDEFDGVCVYDVSGTEVENDMEYIIDRVPTVDAEPVRHGHWIPDHGDINCTVPIIDNAPSCSCYCSVCGEWLVASDEYYVKGRYCPNCGAKMDEGAKL